MAADAAATGVLSTAAQLKYFATLGWPEEDEDIDAAWDAFWAFLASHPPLRCFAVDTFTVSGSGAAPSVAAVDALVDLQHQRPELQVRRVPRNAGNNSFWNEMFDCDAIPIASPGMRWECRLLPAARMVAPCSVP